MVRIFNTFLIAAILFALSLDAQAEDFTPAADAIQNSGLLTDTPAAAPRTAAAKKKKKAGLSGRYSGLVQVYTDSCGVLSNPIRQIDYKVTQKGNGVLVTTSTGNTFGGQTIGKNRFQVTYYDNFGGYPATILIDFSSITKKAASAYVGFSIGYYGECVVEAGGRISRK